MKPEDTGGAGRAFEGVSDLSLGIEEEALLVDAETLAPAPRAAAVLAELPGPTDGLEFKSELPASQVEMAIGPVGKVRDACLVLRDARRRLVAAAASQGAMPIGSGTHPLGGSSAEELSEEGRHRRISLDYGDVAGRQVVSALQVHVGVRGTERAIAVYNGLRSRLPLIAALAANAPYRGGADSSLASVRPTITTMLPRQGLPPALDSWKVYAEALEWGASTGLFTEAGDWWWELRPHPAFGTLEMRVPDTQTTVSDSAAVIALIHCLAASLASAHDAGEPAPEPPPDWKIAENRWSACRFGVEGRMGDPETGASVSTSAAIRSLCERLKPFAAILECEAELEQSVELAGLNGAMRQRAIGARRGPRGLVRWLAESYAEEGDRATQLSEGEPPEV